jgi:hypothetical protein
VLLDRVRKRSRQPRPRRASGRRLTDRYRPSRFAALEDEDKVEADRPARVPRGRMVHLELGLDEGDQEGARLAESGEAPLQALHVTITFNGSLTGRQ